MSSVYKPESDHAEQPQGPATMAGFFEWAQHLCKRNGVREIRLETPEFAVTWKLPQRPEPEEKK